VDAVQSGPAFSRLLPAGRRLPQEGQPWVAVVDGQVDARAAARHGDDDLGVRVLHGVADQLGHDLPGGVQQPGQAPCLTGVGDQLAGQLRCVRARRQPHLDAVGQG
jgi:hypothetical protein